MNILLIRLSAIGDIFFCTALANGIRKTYPECRLSWLAEPSGSGLLKGHPLLDRVITFPRPDLVRTLKGGRLPEFWAVLKPFLRELRKEHYDLVIDPQGLLKSAIWARLARADERIGINGRDGSAFLYDRLIKVIKEEQPLILSEYRELVAFLGGDRETVAMDLWIPPEEGAAAKAFLGAHCERPPVVFCPCTTRPQKHWFDASWARLGDLLVERGHGPVVLLGGPGDGERTRAIASMMKRPPLIAAGERRPIGFALGIIERARGLVGVDTGLSHAGIALGRPTVGLFGSTRPYLETGSPVARILYHPLECSPCKRRPTCNGRYDCMRLHRPERVALALEEMMAIQSWKLPDISKNAHGGKRPAFNEIWQGDHARE